MTIATHPLTNENTIAAENTFLLRLWLQSICLLIFAMVIVGGATRLTDSGLSITEWKPILGAIPPLNSEDWLEAFAKYKQIPEYQLVNKGMSLAEFKVIYWWEWAHRFLGRFIGIVFLLPLLFFMFTKQLSRPLTYKLLFVFALGGLQGFMGWYMVQSGLAERVDVSQYRLAAHLGLAILIFGMVYWFLRDLQLPSTGSTQKTTTVIKLSAYGLLIALFLQIILGAFVAGIDAGKSHNTWPLMDGQLIPDGLLIMSPWYLNFFENVLTVQFDHRILAYILLIWALLHVVLIYRTIDENPWLSSLFIGAIWIVVAIFLQSALGVLTLLAHVPIKLGLLHQAGSVVVLVFVLHHVHMIYSRSQN